ncbi:MAG: hypothetical protein JXR66_01215 [Bacteroidales bacterium]|nr:hypothetical protein [Bacteroidales bacterium]
MKTYKYLILFSVVISVLLAGCESLEVKNENDPDFKTAFSNPSDVKGVAGSLINAWYQTTQEYDGPALMLWTGSDAGTCSWGNANMRWFSNEPRVAFDNTPAYTDAVVSENYYAGLYSTLSYANDVMSKIAKEGMVFTADDGTDETPLVEAIARLSQGLTLGYLGLIYDKVFIVTENTDITQTIATSPYKDVIDTALLFLDECIDICESSTFVLPSGWITGGTYDQTKIGELANTVAALLLSYSPRSKAENDAVDWTRVLGYANNGLTYDFTPECDGIKWYSYFQYYSYWGGWGQTDMRLVNMMDSRFPSRWADADVWDVLPAPVTSHTDGIDDRIFTDFEFLDECGFKTERGYYHFSCYRGTRQDDYIANEFVGPTPVFLKAENDLLKAEALLHTSGLVPAQTIINNGTRVTRGGLAPIGATATEIENAIFHERNIELHTTGMGVEFFTMRKADKLQPGTPLHLPLPGQQLEVNVMDYYTFGGLGAGQKGEPGVDVSAGGWFK